MVRYHLYGLDQLCGFSGSSGAMVTSYLSQPFSPGLGPSASRSNSSSMFSFCCDASSSSTTTVEDREPVSAAVAALSRCLSDSSGMGDEEEEAAVAFGRDAMRNEEDGEVNWKGMG
ncbi:hypothetical protein DAEQUDRAFT_388111 [Daedalea quercina L-15889]|uniref:Uncharacterized protein n=1 Tax=Daedalea quercina L-15889 TaxID=1314783 RepID=A0A165NYG5_9APHY|nr:hypothetical protein DAEQUDRAFT_388111 [Daedalea quercina L-15889]